jgi:hypothetical protein
MKECPPSSIVPNFTPKRATEGQDASVFAEKPTSPKAVLTGEMAEKAGTSG